MHRLEMFSKAFHSSLPKAMPHVKPLALFGCLTLCCLTLYACALYSPNGLRTELANHGPMALSTSNPYIASNLFLAREIKLSSSLRGFIKYRGTPDGIQITKGFFRAPKVYLFYLDKNEGYLLENGNNDWFIRGPEQIPPSYKYRLSDIQATGGNAPLALNEQTAWQTSSTESNPERSISGHRNSLFSEEDIKVSPQFTYPKQSATGKGNYPYYTKPATTSNSKRAALQSVKLSQSGDLIHTVTYPGESLNIIASWYTGSKDYSGRIARINGIKNPNIVNLGEKIRIPRYMLKKTDPLPPKILP